VVLAIAILAVSSILYLELRGQVSVARGWVVTLLILLLLRVLYSLKILDPTRATGFSFALLNRGPRASELAKSAACAVACFVWAIAGGRVLANSTVGFYLLLIPILILGVAFGFFLLRSLL
jgi:hypothetical protein